MSANAIRARVTRRSFQLELDLAWDERVLVVFGPSGAGKSTLFEVVLGLHPDARPLVRIGGTLLDDPDLRRRTPLERRGLGWVPQDMLLFPHLTVKENLRFGVARSSGSRPLMGSGSQPLLETAIEVLELGPLLARRVDEISGGERQRVAMGRALASAPRALLLDEPLASLDLALRARVLPYLLRVRDELDLPILYITHDPDEAMIVGDRAVVIDAGRVVADGPPARVLWSRAVLPLSEALGLENVLEARVLETATDHLIARTPGGLRLTVPCPTPLAPQHTLRLGLRAQDILIAADPPGRISARNVLDARVVTLETATDGVLVHVDAGEPLVAKITRAAADALELAPGARVHLVIKSQALRRLA
jgi:molybdate transport system ATP-binding protein